MPDDLSRFERNLSPTILGSIVSGLEAQRALIADSTEATSAESCGTYAYTVELFMPRFAASTKGTLIPALKALGIVDAFDIDVADFTGLSPEPLDISEVVHEANIAVDEHGTEAAAATGVSVDTGGCTGPSPLKTVTMRLDHPFVYAIRDVATGAILFIGRVVDPSDRG